MIRRKQKSITASTGTDDVHPQHGHHHNHSSSLAGASAKQSSSAGSTSSFGIVEDLFYVILIACSMTQIVYSGYTYISMPSASTQPLRPPVVNVSAPVVVLAPATTVTKCRDCECIFKDRQEKSLDFVEVATSARKDSFAFQPLVQTKGFKLAIFYNIFIPSDVDGLLRAVDIIEEQVDIITNSSALSKGMVTLYYNTIGWTAFKPDDMTKLCSRRKLQCIHMQHYADGFEEVTLSRAHEFCRDPQHSDFRIMYLHNKGAFHDIETATWSQTSWRKHMTMAISDERCLLASPDKCNVCGLNFLPFPSIHLTGNFFTAQCSYIRKLPTLQEYELKMNDAIVKAMRLRTTCAMTQALLKEAPHHYGTGRFTSEHWPYSHPSLKPCDLSTVTDANFWKAPGIRSPEDLVWSQWPRHFLRDDWPYIQHHAKFLLDQAESTGNNHLVAREWFFMAGNMFKWTELYNETPPEDSFAWDFFPQGQTWRTDMLGSINNKTKHQPRVESVLERYRDSWFTDASKRFCTGARF